MTEENVQELILAADMLELSDVVEICSAFLKQQLEPSNAIGIYRSVDQGHCVEHGNDREVWSRVEVRSVCLEHGLHGLGHVQMLGVNHLIHSLPSMFFQVHRDSYSL